MTSDVREDLKIITNVLNQLDIFINNHVEIVSERIELPKNDVLKRSIYLVNCVLRAADYDEWVD